jgi:hypothetical protein
MNIEAEKQRTYTIQVGTVKLVFHEEVIAVAEILERAGAKPPDEFVLEALDRHGGKVVAEFSASDRIKLSDDDRKFFRAVPRGGGRA